MESKTVSLIFVGLQTVMLLGQIVTLVSTYWTSWDLRFNWTKGMHFSKPNSDGELVSQGHAGLWSRCVRVYDLSWGDTASMEYSCLQNYNTTNGSLQFSFGKICKTATAALCVGDTAIIISTVIIALVSTYRPRKNLILVKSTLGLLLFEGMVCFAIPLLYLSGNMAELIDQLSGAYGLLLVIHMSPWYTHDWAFWTQVGLLFIWGAALGVFVILYSIQYASSKRKLRSPSSTETGDCTEMENLRS